MAIHAEYIKQLDYKLDISISRSNLYLNPLHKHFENTKKRP